jgi:HEPN domain-containing protein
MPNKTLAIEWLRKAYHDLSSAHILYDAEHFTDTIGCDLQQAIEKMLKSFLAYENKKIKKTHNLIDVYESVKEHIQLDESEIRILAITTNYYAEDKYPTTYCVLPEREEIEEVLNFAQNLFTRICQTLSIDQQDVKR